MAEKWKDIKGYENTYQVSNFGRIRSLDRIYVQPSKWGTPMFKKYKGKVLNPTDNGNGYLIISLRDDNRNRKNFYVHRLVAEHFLREIAGGEVVNHLDYNKKNNNVENLEWTTISGNTKHFFINNERVKKQVLNNAFNGKETNKKSIKVFLNGIYINTYESITIASKALNINKKTIYNSIFKGMKNRKGYNFCLN